ncbi:MAG: tetratricopeptide repeat protein [Planctomycetes bacterium]|nr:tetratricopeptide repeat protein [Planctomycetota bacterium]
MSTEANWQRAVLLCQQARWDLAVRELRGLLALDADHAHAHALLAMALAQTGDLTGADEESRLAVGLAPESPFVHRALAVVHFEARRDEPAAAAVGQAIALAPGDAELHGLLAQIRCRQRRWPEALAAADAGLALDPHDVDCLNLRSVALAKLGRGAEATDTLDAALAKDPDNPYTHQARGWALLHRGEAEGAMHHFQEALRRAPSLPDARAGLVEALKARNPVYRLVLGWFLWLDGKSHGHQLAILIGAWLAARFGSRALHDAGHETAANAVGLSWFAVVLLTACAVPIFNLLLLANPLGRHALEPRARRDALWLGATVVIGLGVAAWAWLGDSWWALRGVWFWLVFLLPVAGIGLFEPGWGRRVLQAFCVAAVAFWLWWCWRTAGLQAEGAALDLAPDTTSADEEAFLAGVRAHSTLHTWLITACAFSTWFMLLAPKGRSPSRCA